MVGVVGCIGENSNSNNKESIQVTDTTSVAESYVKTEFEKVINDYYASIDIKGGSLEGDEFLNFIDDFNIISNAINSSAKIKMNNPEHIDEEILLLKDNLDFISASDVERAKTSMHSTKLIYESTIMEQMGYFEERIQLNGKRNILTKFSDTSFNSTEEAIMGAKESIEKINSSGSGDYAHYDYVIRRIEYIRNKVSDDGFDELDTIMNLLKNSLDKQVNILQSFVDPLSEVNVDEEFDSALKDYENAKYLLNKFEGNEN